ncbi:hypothetical protein P280DRAFT_489966 [Massarina eburnea CBS 473.64]|uniref:Mediator of RNA polymerase II transcription subunit 9 n=1 Tax=Massarina eburnea CBS 473.64 TaxID=1395130 RepID=A0A6A6S3E4_9PLEO|nr:hypothetical protein P280DRAFT_489966 [Massarina eburnea CBS 473.64]
MSGAPTPHAFVSTATSFAPTGPVTPALPPQPSTPGLPPPSTFDVLPDLHRILSRLLIASAQPPAVPQTPGQPPADAPLEIDQVASATAEVKLKLQRARKAVLDLPDIDRTCEDQEDEIEFLEARIAKLKVSLQRLGQQRKPDADADADGRHTSPDCMDALYRLIE